jgi:hypothetical protein
MPAIVRPAMRRLQCIDPRSIDKFIRVYKKKIESKDLLAKAVELEKQVTYPMKAQDQLLYEELDNQPFQAVSSAE